MKYDLCVKSANGDKSHFENIGLFVNNDNGNSYILLKPWINLAGFDREQGRAFLLVSLFEHREGRQSHDNNNSETASENSSDDDVAYGPIPF